MVEAEIVHFSVAIIAYNMEMQSTWNGPGQMTASKTKWSKRSYHMTVSGLRGAIWTLWFSCFILWKQDNIWRQRCLCLTLLLKCWGNTTLCHFFHIILRQQENKNNVGATQHCLIFRQTCWGNTVLCHCFRLLSWDNKMTTRWRYTIVSTYLEAIRYFVVASAVYLESTIYRVNA